ncbi:MAG: DUF547 domain-containing protein [Planctomycetota bacterium]|jgi:hypothetical protein
MMDRPWQSLRALWLWPLLATLGGCNGSAADTPGPPPGDAPRSTVPATAPDQPPAAGPGWSPDAPPGVRRRLIADEILASLLEILVTEEGLVRYDLLQEDVYRRMIFDVQAGYMTADLPDDDKEKLAFWCNVYNANVLFHARRVARRPDASSVRDIPGFFDEVPIVVAGERMTLNQLENDLIRPLGDPRIHGALVCAAMSCPPLRREPFRAEKLDEQLDEQCRRWINDPSKCRVSGSTLWLSEILKWYEGDFDVEPYKGWLGFVRAYAEPGGPIRASLERGTEPEIRWLPYDWKLNRAPVTQQPRK